MDPHGVIPRAGRRARLRTALLLGALVLAGPALAQGQAGGQGGGQSGEAQAGSDEKDPGFDLPLIGRVGLPGFMAGWFGKEEKDSGGAQQAGKQGGQGGEPPAVIVQTVETRPVGDTFEFIGTIQPIEKVGVRARVEGYIQDVAFAGGQSVKQGDLLFQIEPAQYEAALRAAEAQLSGAEATRNQAQRNYDRQNELVRSGVTARATLEDATASLENAQAQYLQADAAVTQARLDLSYTRITAAIDGEMSAPLITRGNYVSSTTGDLATLTQMNPIWGVFPIGEGQLVTWQRVGPQQADDAPMAENRPNGQAGGGGAEAQGDAGGGEMVASSEMTSSTENSGDAPIASASGTGAAGAPPLPQGAENVDAAANASDNGLASAYRLQLRLPNGALYEPPGRFDFVGNTVNATTGTVEARIRFPNTGDFLLANQNVTLTASERNPPILPVVPQAAIQFSREGRAVLLVKPDNTVERRPIEIGRTIDNASAVTKGLEGGETLVLRGAASVKQGTSVRPVTQEQAEAEAKTRRQNRPQGGAEGEGSEGQGGKDQGGKGQGSKAQGGEGQGGAGSQDGGSGTAAGQNSGSGSSAR
ncbi:efflux RND transporter periplasmic adaptor subunit [Aureimonas sp. AU40]|uniref:efflux RND transporter periplasmic adaptor subunit n=1 Tax=Aureimonas sp. AU40 TaxID=1637747 RepID=UPI0007831AB8|nr:efflux RND transporter periplasmic adaptor subunit [Aureimonas sp. AU40]